MRFERSFFNKANTSFLIFVWVAMAGKVVWRISICLDHFSETMFLTGGVV